MDLFERRRKLLNSEKRSLILFESNKTPLVECSKGGTEYSIYNSYILIGTLETYVKIRRYFGNEKVIPIYIEVDDGIRLQRAIKREQKQQIPHYEEMCRRFLADSADFSEENIANAEIKKRFYNNGLIEECIKEIKDEIKTRLF